MPGLPTRLAGLVRSVIQGWSSRGGGLSYFQQVTGCRHWCSWVLTLSIAGAASLVAAESPQASMGGTPAPASAPRSGSAPAGSGNPGAGFDQANQRYEKGRFPEAIAAYEEMVRAGELSAAVYFNLGNACFKSGQIGKAIVNYRMASRLAPRDPDIRANLQFARNAVGAGASASFAWWHSAILRLTLNEWSLLAAGALWAWFLLLALAQLRPSWKGPLRGLTGLAFTVLVLFGACLVLAWRMQLGSPAAIVVAPEAVVRNGPLEESPSAFTVRDGAELVALDAKDGWIQVRDAAGRTGWIRSESLVTLPTGRRGR